MYREHNLIYARYTLMIKYSLDIPWMYPGFPGFTLDELPTVSGLPWLYHGCPLDVPWKYVLKNYQPWIDPGQRRLKPNNLWMYPGCIKLATTSSMDSPWLARHRQMLERSIDRSKHRLQPWSTGHKHLIVMHVNHACIILGAVESMKDTLCSVIQFIEVHLVHIW